MFQSLSRVNALFDTAFAPDALDAALVSIAQSRECPLRQEKGGDQRRALLEFQSLSRVNALFDDDGIRLRIELLGSFNRSVA